MAIPEDQLETWSHIGAIQQSRDTYASVKAVLEDPSAPHSAHNYESFLQGSYANDTNVYRDSDVDIVVRLDSTWYHDANTLPADQYAAFERAYPGSARYGLAEFKAEVLTWLARRFPGVRAGSKAIFIPGAGARRDCDVLVCARFRYYYRFSQTESYDDGVCFFLPDGTEVINFPKQHSTNCTTKHQATNEWFKPIVRIYKNMRNRMVDTGTLRDGLAPSYFIEGMLSNVPPDRFGTSYERTFIETFNYINSTDRSTFKCANGVHSLLAANSHVSWNPAACDAYLEALRELWTSWP